MYHWKEKLTALCLVLAVSVTGALAAAPTIVSDGDSPDPAGGIATRNPQTFLVDGQRVDFETYALKDADGYLTNYVKIRDLAYALNGTAAQFSVGYDDVKAMISLKSGEAYTPNGGEGETPFEGDRPYRKRAGTTLVNGYDLDLQAFILTDDEDGDYTYYKLRDLGQALNFNVSWDDAAALVVIESDKAYGGAPKAADPITLTTQDYKVGDKTVKGVKVVSVDMSDSRISVKASMPDGKLNNTRSFDQICSQAGADVVINANFFESYKTIKDPIGHVMVDGEFRYGVTGLTSVGFTEDNEVRFGRPAMFFRVKTVDDGEGREHQEWSAFEVNDLKQFANQAVLYTPARGASVPVTVAGAALTVVEGVTSDYRLVSPGDTITIPENGYVFYGDTEVISTTWYQVPQMGRKVEIEPYLFKEDEEGFSLEGVTQMVSGAPRLVKDGAIETYMEDDFARDSRFTKNSSPRTALGYTKDGKLLLVSVPSATVQQMRELMLQLGCEDAVNLDGGGSTGLYYRGKTLSKPGRELTTTLQIFFND